MKLKQNVGTLDIELDCQIMSTDSVGVETMAPRNSRPALRLLVRARESQRTGGQPFLKRKSLQHSLIC